MDNAPPISYLDISPNGSFPEGIVRGLEGFSLLGIIRVGIHGGGGGEVVPRGNFKKGEDLSSYGITNVKLDFLSLNNARKMSSRQDSDIL